jgi:hypothetical protein
VLDRLNQFTENNYRELKESFEGLDEVGSWMRLTPREGDYLHSDGSILGQVTHVAACKVLYASAGFHELEIRLREITDRTIQIGSDWAAAKAYLEEGHNYWLECWQHLCERDLETLIPTNWGDEWPLWKMITNMASHDSYHAGQIALTRAVAQPTDTPPPPVSDEEIEFLKTFKAW